jgi:hypothetical protein
MAATNQQSHTESRYSIISNSDDDMHPYGYHRVIDMKNQCHYRNY